MLALCLYKKKNCDANAQLLKKLNITHNIKIFKLTCHIKYKI